MVWAVISAQTNPASSGAIAVTTTARTLSANLPAEAVVPPCVAAISGPSEAQVHPATQLVDGPVVLAEHVAAGERSKDHADHADRPWAHR